MKNTYFKKCAVSKNSYIEIMLDKCLTKKRELCFIKIPILQKGYPRQRDLMKLSSTAKNNT